MGKLRFVLYVSTELDHYYKTLDKSTVVILINATTLLHKSILSTNNFGNNLFGQKYEKQNIPRFFRRL